MEVVPTRVGHRHLLPSRSIDLGLRAGVVLAGVLLDWEAVSITAQGDDGPEAVFDGGDDASFAQYRIWDPGCLEFLNDAL